MKTNDYQEEKNILVAATIIVAIGCLGFSSVASAPVKDGLLAFNPDGFILGLLVFLLVCIAYPVFGVLLSTGLSLLREEALGAAWSRSEVISFAAFWPIITPVLFPVYGVRILVNGLCEAQEWLEDNMRSTEQGADNTRHSGKVAFES